MREHYLYVLLQPCWPNSITQSPNTAISNVSHSLRCHVPASSSRHICGVCVCDVPLLTATTTLFNLCVQVRESASFQRGGRGVMGNRKLLDTFG